MDDILARIETLKVRRKGAEQRGMKFILDDEDRNLEIPDSDYY